MFWSEPGPFGVPRESRWIDWWMLGSFRGPPIAPLRGPAPVVERDLSDARGRILCVLMACLVELCFIDVRWDCDDCVWAVVSLFAAGAFCAFAAVIPVSSAKAAAVAIKCFIGNLPSVRTPAAIAREGGHIGKRICAPPGSGLGAVHAMHLFG